MRTNTLHLDFAPAARRRPWIGVAMLIVCAALLAMASLLLAQRLAGNARQNDTLAALQARRDSAADSAKPKMPTDPVEIARLRAVRRVAQNLTTPWADMLESLESAPYQSVALLSVEPSVAKRSIRITAEARKADDMLDYLSTLQRDNRLASVVLVSHQVQDKAPGEPVRFQIQAVWGGAQ